MAIKVLFTVVGEVCFILFYLLFYFTISVDLVFVASMMGGMIGMA